MIENTASNPEKSVEQPLIFDPDYQNFVPGITSIKFSTLYNDAIWENFLLPALIVLPVALIAWAVFFDALLYEFNFALNSLTTKAFIIDCKYEPPRKSGGRDIGGEITLSYTYELKSYTSELIKYNDSSLVFNYDEARNCKDYLAGDAVLIQYISNTPAENRIFPKEGNVASILKSGFWIILILPTSPFPIRYMYNRYLYYRAKKYLPEINKRSVLLNGRLTGTKVLRYKIWNKRKYFLEVRAEFITPDGKVKYKKQKFQQIEQPPKVLPAVHQTVLVLYGSDHCYVIL